MAKTAEQTGRPLLGPGEPHPFTVLNENGTARCLLVCEHAGNYVPRALGNLGLPESALARHFAWDIGARHVTERLAALLDAPAILGNISRLVVDLNRALSHPTAFAAEGEGLEIPGNSALTEEDRARRAAGIYEPFHNEVSRLLGAFAARGQVPAFVAIHSFTPVYFRQERPWDLGFLWQHDRRMCAPAIDWFRARGYTVGDNEPYDGRALPGTTVCRHADAPGYPNMLVELRNDHINSQEKGEEWAQMMADCLGPVLSNEHLYSVYEGPRTAFDPAREQSYFDDLIEQAKKGN
jgi:predicted N-formylglutamate amidohydrolase